MTGSDRTPDPADDAVVAYLSGADDVDLAELSDDERAELDELTTLLADSTLWAEPPADLEDRVVARIEQAASTAPIDLAAARAGRAEPEPQADTGQRPVSSIASRRRARWRRPGFLVAAAATVAALAVGTVLILRALLPQAQFEAAMTPTDLAPGAAATVLMTRTDSGWEIHLEATGLPRLDGGQFYEAWLRNEAGVLVPIGTFNEGTDVTLWAGVSPVDFPTITITKETADGDQASSGQRVLVGTAVGR